MKLPHVNKKPLARKRNFVQTPFSRSTLNLERKISRRKTTRFFAPLPVSAWPKSLLQFDFKNHENVRTDLKKRQRPNTIQILWIVKNKRRPIIAPAIAVRLLIRCHNVKRNCGHKWKIEIINKSQPEHLNLKGLRKKGNNYFSVWTVL